MKTLNYKVSYQRKLNESYEVCTCDGGELMVHELEMIRRNNLKGLLPVEFMLADGKGQFWFAITGLQSLSNMQRTGKLNGEMMRVLFESLSKTLKSLEDFLLREESLYIDDVYFSVDGERAYFRYMPMEMGEVTSAKEKLMNLLDDLIKTADYKDNVYITYLFSAYDTLRGENAGLNDVLNISMNREELPEEVFPAEKEVVEENEESIDQKSEHEELSDKVKVAVKERLKSKFLDWRWEAKKKARSYTKTTTTAWDDEEVFISPTAPKEEQEHKTQMLRQTESERNMGVLENLEGKKEHFALDKKKLVLGKRKEFADLVVDDPSVSRVHALIEREEDGYYLEDLNSLNGTFLNGMPLELREKVRLKERDEIKIGHSRLVFRREAY